MVHAKIILKRLERKYCINTDVNEVQQAYLRIFFLALCAAYCYSIHNTPYLRTITALAVFATIFFIIAAWRKIWNDEVRHIAALAYDCLIIGLVMVGLGSDFMGLFGVLLWISIGYGIRYRKPLYLKLGIVFSGITFIVSALVTRWSDWYLFFTLLATLMFVPLLQLSPISKILNLLQDLDVANKELGEANKTKTRFISNVSHDLLTPVSSIIGYCEVSPPVIDGIRISAYQLTRQIRAILGKAASEDLSYEEYLELFSADELLQQIVMVVRPLADSQNIQILFRTEPVTGTFIGPVHAISICLINLVNNAAKHSGGDTIHLGSYFKDNSLHFTIADNGRGISDDEREHIFKRFYRSTRSESTEGLGLGLAIVKDTIDKISGTVQLKPSPLGTTFEMSIPVKIGEPLAKAPLIQAQKVGLQFSETILFVDDEYQSRNVWAAVLRGAGYWVHAASSGSEALAAIESGNIYQTCVLDYRMPEMNGIEVAQKIRTIQPQLKIIIISADVIGDQKELFEDAIRRGIIDAALGKPIHPGRLVAAVGTVKNVSSLDAGQS